MAGVLAGVLLVSMLPVGAATGDPVIAGAPNQAGKATKMRSIGPSTLKLINTRCPGGVALDLVTPAGIPPMRVNRAALVQNLNADLVDGVHSVALSHEAGGCSNDNIPPGDWGCTVTINAPAAGTLYMNGSVDAWRPGSAGADRFWCQFKVDGTDILASDRDVEIAAPVDYVTCASNAWKGVTAGSHSIRFFVDGVDDAQTDLQQGSFWVIWLP